MVRLWKQFRAGEAEKARRRITRAWQDMHYAMLSEFDRDVPIKPVSKYLESGKSEIDDLIKQGAASGNPK